MTNYSNQLLELQAQIAEKEHIEAKLLSLRTQQEELECNISRLAQIKLSETRDVERLERASLLGAVLHLVGSYDKKLNTLENRLKEGQDNQENPDFLRHS